MSAAIGLAAGIIAAAFLCPGISSAQSKPSAPPFKPVTVCEVLANPAQFDGKNLLVLGRSNQTFEGHWLAEDDCGTKLTMAGRTWPNSVWLECCRTPAPDPPSGTLAIDKDALDQKLQQVRQTTQLRYHLSLVTSPDEKAGARREVMDDWAVAYGRLEVVGEIPPPRNSLFPELPGQKTWNHGFGHLGAAPVQLVINRENLRIIPDPAPPLLNGR